MAVQAGHVRPAGFAATERTDAWWVAPLVQGLMLGTLICYANWAAYQGEYYEVGNYLSPLYSPLIIIPGLPFSPAFLILLPPVLFRATCYYYRKAYYRAFFLDPPACAVSESRRRYKGETAFPFVLQNVHRLFLYVAVLYLGFLWYDAVRSYRFDGRFAVGLGSLILTANVVLLSLYTLSCHSLRHIGGGSVDCFSCSASGRARHGIWSTLTLLNERHMLFAWLSLVSVGLTDLYVRELACGAIRDIRFI